MKFIISLVLLSLLSVSTALAMPMGFKLNRNDFTVIDQSPFLWFESNLMMSIEEKDQSRYLVIRGANIDEFCHVAFAPLGWRSGEGVVHGTTVHYVFYVGSEWTCEYEIDQPHSSVMYYRLPSDVSKLSDKRVRQALERYFYREAQ